MSRCEKLTTVACLILLLLGLIRLYQIQHTAANTSLHLFLQPQILPAEVEDAKLEDQEEETRSSLIVSETTSSVAATYYYSSDSTTSETYSTYSSSEETTSTESTSTAEKTTSTESSSSVVDVVFYNRSSTFSLQTYILSYYPGSQRLVQKTWHSSSSSLPSRMSSSKGGLDETVEVR